MPNSKVAKLIFLQNHCYKYIYLRFLRRHVFFLVDGSEHRLMFIETTFEGLSS